MTLRFDVFWSFRSPYSYLAGPRLLALTETYDVECVLRPVHPIALRIENYLRRRSRRRGPISFATIHASPSTSACR